VVRQALKQAGQCYESIDAIAVTQGPGLAGALLVGISYAKALAFALQKPLIAVNHLEGHIHAVLLEEKQKGNRHIRFPVLALVVSGGHTHLYLARPLNAVAVASGRARDTSEQNQATWIYQNVGHTRDDAAGEAFDKVAKLLALGYPGGPIIETLAQHGNPQAVKFLPAQIKHRDRKHKQNATIQSLSFDFSYSGIKTAVLRYVETHNMKAPIEGRRRQLAAVPNPGTQEVLSICDQSTLDLVASFQWAMVEDLVSKTLSAAREYEVVTLFVTGGVAANRQLRRRFEEQSRREGLAVYFPSRALSTDNAAMIAAAAYPKFLAKDFAAPQVSAEASLRLG